MLLFLGSFRHTEGSDALLPEGFEETWLIFSSSLGRVTIVLPPRGSSRSRRRRRDRCSRRAGPRHATRGGPETRSGKSGRAGHGAGPGLGRAEDPACLRGPDAARKGGEKSEAVSIADARNG